MRPSKIIKSSKYTICFGGEFSPLKMPSLGLSSAPRILMKSLRPDAACMLERSIWFEHFISMTFLWSSTENPLIFYHLNVVLNLIRSLMFLINEQISVVIPFHGTKCLWVNIDCAFRFLPCWMRGSKNWLRFTGKSWEGKNFLLAAIINYG